MELRPRQAGVWEDGRGRALISILTIIVKDQLSSTTLLLVHYLAQPLGHLFHIDNDINPLLAVRATLTLAADPAGPSGNIQNIPNIGQSALPCKYSAEQSLVQNGKLQELTVEFYI